MLIEITAGRIERGGIIVSNVIRPLSLARRKEVSVVAVAHLVVVVLGVVGSLIRISSSSSSSNSLILASCLRT